MTEIDDPDYDRYVRANHYYKIKVTNSGSKEVSYLKRCGQLGEEYPHIPIVNVATEAAGDYFLFRKSSETSQSIIKYGQTVYTFVGDPTKATVDYAYGRMEASNDAFCTIDTRWGFVDFDDQSDYGNWEPEMVFFKETTKKDNDADYDIDKNNSGSVVTKPILTTGDFNVATLWSTATSTKRVLANCTDSGKNYRNEDNYEEAVSDCGATEISIMAPSSYSEKKPVWERLEFIPYRAEDDAFCSSTGGQVTVGCTVGSECFNNKCQEIPDCVDGADCQAALPGAECIAGECVLPTPNCSSDLDCESGEICQNNTLFCEPAPALPATCTSDAECPVGLYYCDQTGTAPFQCERQLITCQQPDVPSQTECQGNLSIPCCHAAKCMNDIGGSICVPRDCIEEDATCVNTSDCCGSLRCDPVDRQCTREVACTGEYGYCPSGSGCCTGLTCRENEDDEDSLTCLSAVEEPDCVDKGEECDEADDCCEGLRCSLLGKCQPSWMIAVYIGILVGGLLLLVVVFLFVTKMFGAKSAADPPASKKRKAEDTK